MAADRRSFIRATVGALAGAAALPFLPKAAPPAPVPLYTGGWATTTTTLQAGDTFTIEGFHEVMRVTGVARSNENLQLFVVRGEIGD